MENILKEIKEFSYHDIAHNRILAIDPNNVFWATLSKHKSQNPLSYQKILSLYKQLKQKLDLEMKDFRFRAQLTAIYIDPIDKCNANCPYCYIPAKIRKSNTYMDNKKLTYVLRKIADYFQRTATHKKPVIVFHASEPLLLKDIIFKAINNFQHDFYFGIQTNGLLLEKDDVEFMKRNRLGVGISLDSFDPRVNNRLRPDIKGRGNLDKVKKAFQWFDGYPGLNVITTITKFNVSQLSKFVEFLHAQKVSCVLLNPLRLTLPACRSLQADQKLMIRYFREAIDKAMQLSRDSARTIVIGNFANVILAIIAPVARRLMCDISPCGGGRCFLTITASGRMIPCGEFIGLKGFSGGNIFNTSISRAMESKPFKKIRARVVEEIEECSICDFRNICGAPCPAELHSRGDMYQPSVFCEFYKEIIKYAFKLIAEDKVKYLLRKESLKNLEFEYDFKNLNQGRL